MVVIFAPLRNDKPLRVYTVEMVVLLRHIISTHKHFADSADSCSLITSPVCCQVTLVGCIFFVYRTNCFVKFLFLFYFPSFVFYFQQ